MEITKKLIKFNFNEGGNSKKYLVIHDTGNYNNGAGAINHYTYFNGGNRGASAHYFVDDKFIIQTVEDNNISWHSGVKYGSNQPRKEVNNYNSIGIEVCVNPDSDYDKAFDNTVELTKYLMQLYDISVDNVVRHYDACLKSCPHSMKSNDWELWKAFKERIEEEEVVTQTQILVNGEVKTVNRILKDGTNYVGLRDLCELVGVDVGYDEEKKLPILNN